MKKKELKVFHGLVNYGSQAGLISKSLRNCGVDSTSVAYGDKYKRSIDFVLLSGGSFLEKIIKNSKNWFNRIRWFCKYNTFHFYFGTSLFPYQLDLPLYKFFGKVVIHHYLGKDVKLYKKSIETYEISNMAYSCGSEEKALIQDEKTIKRLKFETKYSSKQIVCSPVYLEFVPGSKLVPLGIDLSKYIFQPKENIPEIITILHAPSNRLNKGTKYIINAIDKLKAQGYKINFELCENVTHKELVQKYIECDLFIDQVLGGYGTAAIEAMAIGRPTISFLRRAHFNLDTIPYPIPIIIANRDTIFSVLKDTLDNSCVLIEKGKKSRKYIEDFHDLNGITKELIDLYLSLHK